MRNMHKVNKDLLAQNQDLVIKVNRLKQVAGMRDDEIETELQKRNKQMMQSLKKLCEDASRIYDVCVEQSRRSTGIGEGRGSSMGAGEDRQASSNGGEEGPVSSTAGEDGPGLSIRDTVLVKDAVQSGPRSVPLKTPAMCEDTVASKKGATKSSRKGKSTSKRPPNQNSAGVDEGTPKAKKSKASAENPSESDKAVLKKRLTMIMNSKAASTQDRKNEAPLRVADLDRTVEENPVLQDLQMEPIHDDDDDSDRKHRRNRNPVSYVPKPLNAKLRQGDQGVENGNSNKVKAVISRQAIARKTCVPKVSRDDKENVDQTKTK
ncbi:uncharacterized protein LOC127855188 [Dreissena polymorpha]|nr:uncharacterized protein LOC127855188 [Dreissena polymorpha]XP_052246562.1 uncharacterized protein LOC127855188 [Dreissena polymorpha]XP_052246563.1 uncharacterized protein LOC127855188 [Dreissena polymorpha]